MPFECALETWPGQPALSVRVRTSVDQLRQVLGQTYGAIAGYLAGLGEAPAGPPFTAYHNMDMTDLDVEIGFPVARPLAGRGEIDPARMPGGRVATCRFTGPYSELKPAYEALTCWVAEGGHEPTGVAYELYLNDPAVTPPDRLETRIVFPLSSPA
jgi:effector-binding domain-containing protein